MEDTNVTGGPQDLFKGLVFTVVPTALPASTVQNIQATITSYGGTFIPFDMASGRIENPQDITYIISTTTDFPDYYRTLDLLVPVVKPVWLEHSVKTSKVKNPRSYSPDPALFLNDVTICCGNIPEGDVDAIAGGVLAMGGQFSSSLSKLTTHLVALDMDDEVVKLALHKRIHVQIVLPHWFDDCLRVGRRLKERPYLFPNPEILRPETSAIPASKTSESIRDASDPEPSKDPLPMTPSAHAEEYQVIRAFAGKRLKFGEDLKLNARLKDVLTGLIKAGGGSVTTNIDEADIYVCNYRDGTDYVTASQAQKDVGNLNWLYYLITYGTWTNPMRRMLHYPRPRDGIPGFAEYKISISSYIGEARIYLENLVKATGATFTKTFKQENTHLVTAHKNSEKCDAAQEWGVHVVNHLWLEDAYALCKEQTLTNTRYTHFPPRTNLGEVLGTTEIDRCAVEAMFFPSTTNWPTPVKAAAGKQISSRAKGDRPTRSSPLADKTSRISRVIDDVATPVAIRQFSGKENETPGTTGSRGAKNRALSRLHESAEDIAKFEKEMKRKGGVIHGGRRAKDEEDKENSKRKPSERDSTASKRSIDEVDEDDESTEDDDSITQAARNAKKTKREKLTPIKYRMLLSKHEPWQNDADRESKDKARLREVGLFITEDPKNIDIVCAPRVVRTRKFVAAIACAPLLVSTTYLDHALKNNKLPNPEKHRLEDGDFEKAHGFELVSAITRAKQNKHRLLKDWTIFCSANVTGGFETYDNIVSVNGGRCQLYKGRTTNVTASKRQVDARPEEVSQNLTEDEGDVLYLISEPKKGEFGLWQKFRELAKKHDMIPRIVRTEWLLYVAMAQQMRWDADWELSEQSVTATGT